MIRIAALAALAVAALTVLVKLWVAPAYGGVVLAPLEWAAEPRLPGWELTGPEPLVDLAEERPKAAAGAAYSYRKAAVVVTVEIRSFPDSTGDSARYAEKLKQAEETGHLQRVGSGWYRVRYQAGRAIVEACLDSKGRATATPEQFAANRRQHDRTWERLGRWLLGRTSLHDVRCLWWHASVPAEAGDLEKAAGAMEPILAAWQTQLTNPTDH